MLHRHSFLIMFTVKSHCMYNSNEEQNKKQLEALERVRERAMTDINYARSIIEAVTSGSDSPPNNCNNSPKVESPNAQPPANQRNRFS
jgi:hypothetical protein